MCALRVMEGTRQLTVPEKKLLLFSSLIFSDLCHDGGTDYFESNMPAFAEACRKKTLTAAGVGDLVRYVIFLLCDNVLSPPAEEWADEIIFQVATHTIAFLETEFDGAKDGMDVYGPRLVRRMLRDFVIAQNSLALKGLVEQLEKAPNLDSLDTEHWVPAIEALARNLVGWDEGQVGDLVSFTGSVAAEQRADLLGVEDEYSAVGPPKINADIRKTVRLWNKLANEFEKDIDGFQFA
jgi:hypothetical protein